jgi:hypothetical protein
MNEDSLPIDFDIDARPWPKPVSRVQQIDLTPEQRDLLTCKDVDYIPGRPVSWWRRLWERIAGRVEDE